MSGTDGDASAYPSSGRSRGVSLAGGIGSRDYNDDESSAAYNPTNAGLISTRVGGPSSSRAGGMNDYLSRKTGEDLKLLNENLTRELEEKEAEIRRLEDETHKGVIQQKYQRVLHDNRALQKRLDEIRGYQTDSKTHLEDNAALLAELESVKGEMIRSKNDYENLIRNLQAENEQLKDDLHACEVKIGAYERETNELEEELASGEREKDAMRAEMNQMKNQLQALRSGGRVSELEEKLQNCTLLLQSKEVENDTLLTEMQALTQENDQLRALQTEHIQEVQVKHTQEQSRARSALEEKQAEIQLLKQEIQTQIERNKQLESFKSDHDAIVLELRNKMTEYENGYGLTDAVAEIRQIKTALKKSQLDRASEKDLINRREKELQRYVAENRHLKKLAGIEDPESWGLNAEELQLQQHIELQKLQALHRTDQKIIKKMEADRMELLDELRKGTTDRTRDGLVYLGLDAEKMKLLEEYVERLKNDDPSLPQSDQSFLLQQKLDQQTKDLEAWKDRYARVQVEKDEMSSKLMSLMERDKGLAYDQILKQITDLKVQYNMAQLSQTVPLHGHPTMPSIPESPARGGGLTSPRSVKQAPTPLPSNSSAELRVVAERAANLSLPERHALFARLHSEFQPGTPSQPQGQPVMAGSRLMSPRALDMPGSAQSTRQGGSHVFTFPSVSPTTGGVNVSAGGADSSSIVAPAQVPFEPYAPSFEAQSTAMLSLDAKDLASMDSQTKAKLVGCLTELLGKERENNELLDALELYQIRFEKLSARQQMLYIEYNNGRKGWAEEKESLAQRLQQALEQKEKVDLQLAQVQSVSSQHPTAPGSIEEELEQLRRKNLVLLTNEKVLARRYTALEDAHTQSLSQLTATKKEFIEMEHTLRLRVQELSKRKKILETRCTSIQELTSTWVPKEELMKLARKYNWISAQYAEMITKQDLNIIEKNTLNETKRENENLKYKSQELETELKLQVEKNKDLHAALDEVERTMIPDPNPGGKKKGLTLAQKLGSSQGSNGSSSLPTSTTQSVPSLLAELADLKARESSATKRCMRLDENLASINSHSLELEEELLTVRKKYHELSLAFQSEQEVVLELRNKIEGSVPYFKVNQLQQQLLESQEKLVSILEQLKHYKEIADLANHQSIQLLNLRGPEDPKSDGYDDLVRGLQETINLLQSNSDDATQLGKVHRENMNLKLQIRKLEKDVQHTKKEQIKLQQSYGLLEKELDLKHSDMYRLHNNARVQLSEKEKVILDLTSKNSISGSTALNHPMTLQQAETIHQSTLKMQQQLEEAERKARTMKEENDKYYLQVSELQIKLQQAQELANIMPPGAFGNVSQSQGGKKLSSSRGRSAGVGVTLNFDEPFNSNSIDGDDPPLPASLSLVGSHTTVIDPTELNLKLRQNLVKYSNELSKFKLSEVKNLHTITTLQSKLEFTHQEIATYESQIAKLQQDLIEKELYITTKENSFKDQYMYLKEQETKLKMEESLKRMEITKKNKRQQQNAIVTLKRITGQENPGSMQLGGGPDDDPSDPFAVHDSAGNTLDIDEDFSIDALTGITEELDSTGQGPSTQPRMLEGLLLQLQSKLRLAKQVMSDQKEKLHDLEAENERILSLKQADESALNSAQEVATLERARLLSQAQQTIQNLNEQLASKNSRIEKYQDMLEQAQIKFKERKKLDELEIERLNHELLEKNTTHMGKLNSAMTFLDELPRLPKDVISRVEMEEILQEKEKYIVLLNKEVEFLKVKCSDESEARDMIDAEMKKLFQQSSAEITALKQDIQVLEAAKQDDIKMNKLIAKLRSEMSEKDAAVAKMEEAMTQLKDSMLAGAADFRKMNPVSGESKADAAGLGEEVDYKKQCATLERKLKAAIAATAAEKQKTKDAIAASAAVQDSVAHRDEQIALNATALKAKQEEVDSIRLKLIQSQNQLSKVQEQHSKHKAKSAKEIEELRIEKEKAADIVERKAKLQLKMEGTGEKVKELASSKGRDAPTASSSGPKEEEKDSSTGPSSSSAALASKAFNDWEAEKKSAKKLALLSTKVTKQLSEIRTLQDAVEKLTKKLEKEQKEKLDLFQRFTSLQQQLQQVKGQLSGSSFANLDVGGGAGGNGENDGLMGVGAPSDADLAQALTKEQLKQKLFDLQAQHDALARKLAVDVPQQIAVLKEDVASAQRKAETFLREKREAEKLAKDAGAKIPRNKSSLTADTSSVEQHITSLENNISTAEARILELTIANLDLKYSSEHSNILVSRLRTRVQELSHLLKLVDGNYLAKEWQDLIPKEVKEFIQSVNEGVSGSHGSSSTPSLDLHKPQQQHRALTLILSTFRKIFEKLKHENESLRKNSQTNIEFMNMVKENKQLKKKLQTQAQDVIERTEAGGSANKENKPSTATSTNQQSTESLPLTASRDTKEVDVNLVSRADLERSYSLHTLTRKELKKEQESNARLKKKLTDLAKDLETAHNALHEADKKLTTASATTNVEWFRKEKNYLASLDDLTRARNHSEEEVKRLKLTIKEMKQQQSDMAALIAHVRTEQSQTQERVLAAAQVQAAVLSQTEQDNVKERKLTEELRKLQSDLHQMQQERDRLARENAALKHELSAFDAQFFEELEDLKYRYAQAVEQVQKLTKQLEQGKVVGANSTESTHKHLA